MYILRVYTSMFFNGNPVPDEGIFFEFESDEALDAFVISQLPKDGEFYFLGQMKKKGWRNFRVMDVAYDNRLIYSSEDEAEWEEGY